MALVVFLFVVRLLVFLVEVGAFFLRVVGVFAFAVTFALISSAGAG